MTGRYPSHTGIGPSVIVMYNPFGVPARETMLPELLKAQGYSTHMVGKWHLGACDNRYEPTYRGFDSYMGYLAGGEGYYNHQSDFRNGSTANELPFCMGAAVSNNYTSALFADEVGRIVRAHDPAVPSFVYLAFQSVHIPYDDPTASGIPGTNVNESYPEIVDYTRRIYAGMVAALDDGVARVEKAYKDAGMWEETVMIFSTDVSQPASRLPSLPPACMVLTYWRACCAVLCCAVLLAERWD
jgi:arylsulfatase A-like enzyme